MDRALQWTSHAGKGCRLALARQTICLARFCLAGQKLDSAQIAGSSINQERALVRLGK
jgi:hypothetical protein